MSTVLPYWAPHPGRGTGHHRILFILLKELTPFTSRDPIEIKDQIQEEGLITGFSFFRVCWTKAVLDILKSNPELQDCSVAEVGSVRHAGANPEFIKNLNQ